MQVCYYLAQNDDKTIAYITQMFAYPVQIHLSVVLETRFLDLQ